MGRINASGGAKGLEINGIIEEYIVAAGENINAGDFVEYFNNNTLMNYALDTNLHMPRVLDAVVVNQEYLVCLLYGYNYGVYRFK